MSDQHEPATMPAPLQEQLANIGHEHAAIERAVDEIASPIPWKQDDVLTGIDYPYHGWQWASSIAQFHDCDVRLRHYTKGDHPWGCFVSHYHHCDTRRESLLASADELERQALRLRADAEGNHE